MHMAHFLQLLHQAQRKLADAYRDVAAAHQGEVDVFHAAQRLAHQADGQTATIAAYLQRYQRESAEDPQPSATFRGPRGPGVGLLRDLQELYLMVAECDICWLMIDAAAQGARDTELLADARRCHEQTRTQQAWLRTQLANSTVQALVVA